MKKKALIAAFIMICCTAFAQKPGKEEFSGSPVVAGPRGTYIYVKDADFQKNKLIADWQYIILKEEKTGKGFKKIAEMHFPTSAIELEKAFDKSTLQSLLQQGHFLDVQALYNTLRSGHFDSLGLNLLSPTVLQGLGLLYIDASVTKASAGVSYRLDKIEDGKVKTLYQVNLGSISLAPLKAFREYKTVISDSSATLTWYATGASANYASIYTNASTPKNNLFEEAGRQMVLEKGDTLFLTYFAHTPPDKKLQFYIRAEDIAGNRGPESDTIRFLSLKFDNRISISNFTATDTLGSVWLSWDSLPSKAWLSGIEVLKSRFATENFIVIDTLPVSAVHYRDQRIISGNIYYYQVRPLLFDLPQKGRITPSVVSVRTKVTPHKISAPQGLEVKSASADVIRLGWLPNADLDIFSYYILRGTTLTNLKVISTAIRDTVYRDSLKGLQPGITYLYAIAAVDMNLQWSDTSLPVALQSPIGKLVTAPSGIQARPSAWGVRLLWSEVGNIDASISGYLLYRRKKGDEYFIQLTKTPVSGTTFIDSSTLSAGDYEYGCSSVDAWNHVSILSPLAGVHLENDNGANPLYAPPAFLLRNMEDGIEIVIPATLYGDGETKTSKSDYKYNLYRRISSVKKFQKIGEVLTGSLSFIDGKVSKDQLYVYTITLQKGKVESAQSSEKSLRRR